MELNKETTLKVLDYIKNSWAKSIRDANDVVPYPFTSPSITGCFKNFFYWDNYFINKGLLIDGLDYQVKNNLDIFKYFVESIGFMPNATDLLNRTQPPFFARSVYDYYKKHNDENIIKEYLPALLKEYDYFMTNRILPMGLNAYSHSASKPQLLINYKYLSLRVLEFRESEEDKLALSSDILAIAESGLDFNMRFRTKESKVDAHKFIHLDLNCILYEVENTISEFYSILGDEEKKNEFSLKAKNRKELMDKYLYSKEDGIYLDYNYKDNSFSEIVSAVSLYPYTFGISKDKDACKKIVDMLELPYGISPCPYRGEDVYYQWDYPCIWPYTTWFSYIALKNVGLDEDAKRIALKYMECVNINFEKTGIIYEKYDGRDGSVAVTNEYETPEMLGWSAGVYKVFAEELGFDKE